MANVISSIQQKATPSSTNMNSYNQQFMNSYNQQFMKNNPQYGYNGNPNPTDTKGNSFSSAFNRLNPQEQATYSKANPNVDTTTGLLKANTQNQNTQQSTSQTQENTQNQNVPAYNKSVEQLNTIGGGQGTTIPYQDVLKQKAQQTPAQSSIDTLTGFSQNQSPDVQNAFNEYKKFTQESPYMIAAQSNPNVAADIASGRSSLLANVLAQRQQGLAQNVANRLQGQGQQIGAAESAGGQQIAQQGQQIGATESGANVGLTQQGQQISASQAAGGLAQPYQQGYVLIDPTTGKTVNVEGAGNAIFQGGQYGTIENQGAKYQDNTASINAGRNIASNIPNLLSQYGLNQGNVNILNSLFNAYNTNTSGQYPAIQTAFNNAIAQYAKVLGPQKISSMIEQSKGSTIGDFFNLLEKQAQSVQSSLKNSTQEQNQSQSNTESGSKYDF